MLTLPNGDKWIIDDKELEGLSEDQVRRGEVPETPARDFVTSLRGGTYFFPRKLTTEFGGYWDADFDPYAEVIGGLAAKTLKTDFCTVYEMPWGEVLVVYKAADSGGHDVITKVATFPSRDEYNQSVRLG